MLIENLVIYTRTPFQDKQGRNVYHGFPINDEADHYVAQHWSGWEKSKNALMLEFKEFPVFKDLIITALNHRGNGGRAYQALIPIELDNSYVQVDLREDTLMETILNKGIEAGGKLKGEYAFVKNGSQVNLVLVGSNKYNEAKEKAENKKKMKKISNKDLKIGYEYSTIKGEPYVYLGAYYQHEVTSNSFVFSYSEKPVLHHVFYDRNRQYIVFRKNHVFTIESETPTMDKDVADEIMFEYSQNGYKRFIEVLEEIREVYSKYYVMHTNSPSTISKEQAVRIAQSSIKKLSNVAFENYRQYATTITKDECNFDKEFIRTMVSKAKTEAVESVKDYNFL